MGNRLARRSGRAADAAQTGAGRRAGAGGGRRPGDREWPRSHVSQDAGTAATANSWCTRVAAALLLASVAGCASAPVVRLHSLSAPADAASMAVVPVGNAVGAAPAAPLLVDLDVVRVPVEVAQPQWLVRLPDETLRLLEDERWAAPLRDELRAALMQALVDRFGASDARSRPAEPTTEAIRDALPAAVPLPQSTPPSRPAAATGGRSASLPPAAAALPSANAAAPAPRRVSVDVTRFESLPGREARLDVAWTVTAATIGPTARAAGSPPAVLVCRSLLREPVGTGAPALAAGHRRAVAALADAIGRTLAGGPAAVCPPGPA